MTEQTCTLCRKSFPVADFEGRKRCSACRERIRRNYRKPERVAKKDAYDKARYDENPQRKIDANRSWRNRNPDQFLPAHRNRIGRRRAKKKLATVEVFSHDKLITFWIGRGIDPERCFYCEGTYQDNDHVVPIADGGTHERANLLPACSPCNDSKGAKPLSEWRGGIHEERALLALGRAKEETAQPNPTSATQPVSPETGTRSFKKEYHYAEAR